MSLLFLSTEVEVEVGLLVDLSVAVDVVGFFGVTLVEGFGVAFVVVLGDVVLSEAEWVVFVEAEVGLAVVLLAGFCLVVVVLCEVVLSEGFGVVFEVPERALVAVFALCAAVSSVSSYS